MKTTAALLAASDACTAAFAPPGFARSRSLVVRPVPERVVGSLLAPSALDLWSSSYPTRAISALSPLSSNVQPGGSFAAFFDFASKEETKRKAVDSFERIDDAIMGGISVSALRGVPGEGYASWSGVCRTDGGGFCGVRTLPFVEPLNATGCDGVFVDCRLASDDEPERRVWKMTLRTDPSRGETVYQAAFALPKRGDAEESTEGDWSRVKIPFVDFQLVRGPRVVPGASALDSTLGIYQIGLSLSKFVIGLNMTQLENFRPGYFDLQLRQIGFYSENYSSTPSSADLPRTLTKDEMERKRPLLLKMLLPVAKLLFSEKANRRKSAMKNLTEKRGLSRPKAMIFGIKTRAGSCGILQSIAEVFGIVAIDSLRTMLGLLLRFLLFYPLAAIGKAIKFVKNRLGMNANELPPME